MKKKIQIVFISLVMLVLAGLGVMTLFFAQTEPGEYMLFENRKLAEKPVLSVQSLFDGSYFKDTETYLSDHLYSRSSFLSCNILLQKMTGCVSVNDTIEADGVLLLDNGVYDKGAVNFSENAEIVSQRLSAVRDVTEEYGGTFLYVLVPTQRNIFEESYPAYLNSDRERTEDILSALLPALEEKRIDTLFMEDTFRQSNEPLTALYSPVDHHFTLKGANLCVRTVIDRLNENGAEVPQLTEDDLSFEELPNPLLGTYNRKLLFNSVAAKDYPLTYTLSREVPYERWDNGTQIDAPVIDLPQTEHELVQYTIYMGGDKAETIIKTNRPELKKVLIVGDSFTNAMETLLYLSFDEMRSLDYRYYNEKALTDYIAEYQPDVVLIVRDTSVCLNLDGNGDLK